MLIDCQVLVAEETRNAVFESEGGVQRLVITSVDIDKQGRYTCVAENTEGKAESQATLTVQS